MKILLAPFYRWRKNVRNWVTRCFNTSARHQSVATAKVEIFDNEHTSDLWGWYEMWYIMGYAVVYNSVNINNDLGEKLKGRVLSHLDRGHSCQSRLISTPQWSSAQLSKEGRAHPSSFAAREILLFCSDVWIRS